MIQKIIQRKIDKTNHELIKEKWKKARLEKALQDFRAGIISKDELIIAYKEII